MFFDAPPLNLTTLGTVGSLRVDTVIVDILGGNEEAKHIVATRLKHVACSAIAVLILDAEGEE